MDGWVEVGRWAGRWASGWVDRWAGGWAVGLMFININPP